MCLSSSEKSAARVVSWLLVVMLEGVKYALLLLLVSAEGVPLTNKDSLFLKFPGRGFKHFSRFLILLSVIPPVFLHSSS